MIRLTLRFALLTAVLVVAVLASPAGFAQKAPAKTQAPAKAQARPNKQSAAKPKKVVTVGPAIGGNKATPVDRISVAKGFQVELLYSVPGVEQGSWVNLCADNKGRLLVSDQFGGLYRITPPAAGQTVEKSQVESVPADIRAVNGMVWLNDALYVGVNDY